MKNRPARVRELIQRELGAIIAREMNFTKLVTIQAVDLTADFKHSHVHVGVMGTDREQKDVIHALAERRPHLQHELAKRVILKYTPQIHFHLDHSIARGTKVMEIMRQIDEVTPVAAEADPEDAPEPINALAAKEAADMEAQDLAEQRRQEEEAARHEIETDGADDEQDETFEELAVGGLEDDAAATDNPAAKKEDRPSRPSRGAQNRTAREESESHE